MILIIVLKASAGIQDRTLIALMSFNKIIHKKVSGASIVT
jgi:hypothetical protein